MLSFEEIALMAAAVLKERLEAMAPSEWGVPTGRRGGSGSFGGMDGIDDGIVADADSQSQGETLSQPRFQAFLKGAWWEVKILARRSEMFLIRSTGLQDETESQVPISCLRFLDRRCDDWDCCTLRTGIDVSVQGVKHPQEEMLRPSTTMAAYDAKIVNVAESEHQPAGCSCKFLVKFYSIKDGLHRVLLEAAPAEEVDISKLSILQKAGIMPLNEIVEEHISGRCSTEQSQWSRDAYSLTETELKILRESRGGENFSEDGLANLGGRQETVKDRPFGVSQALKGNQGKLPKRATTNGPSARLQKSGPLKPIPKHDKFERDEVEKDEKKPAGFAKTDGEKEQCVNFNNDDTRSEKRDEEKERCVNHDNDHATEMPCPTDQKKPTFDVFWNRMDSCSDSDGDMVSEKGPSELQHLWPEFDEEPTAVGTNEAAQPKLHADDLENLTRCQHCRCKLLFKDDLGYVCGTCGLIWIPIEYVVPKVGTFQRRRKEANSDDWESDRNFPPVVNQGAMGHGRIQHQEVETMLSKSLPLHYAKQMHPHQKAGFEFLWRHLGHDSEGNVRSEVPNRNVGCILAHAPGTGKSFLVVSFLRSYMEIFPRCRPLIVVPSIMLLRWKDEFTKWKSGMKVFILNNEIQYKKRMDMLNKWRICSSVCLVSYALFASMTYEKGSKRGRGGQEVRTSLLESPGILVLDECHVARNRKSQIYKALKQVKTHARIFLSGTLFQNNFDELFNILSLARPGFADSDYFRLSSDLTSDGLAKTLADRHFRGAELVSQAAETKARKLFVKKIGKKIREELLCKGSAAQQRGCQMLQRLTMDFIDHHAGNVLASLPGLRDFGIVLKPTTLQCSLLEIVEERLQRPAGYLKRENSAAASETLKIDIAVSEICIHPQLLKKLDFVVSDPNLLEAVSRYNGLSAMSSEPGDPQDGVKTKFVFGLLRSLKPSGEKVLIFSEHLAPLQMLEDMFKEAFNWDTGKDVLRLDGRMSLDDREGVINRFNDPRSQAQVLIASTKACKEGINLVGASRVVVLDALWNPAVIKQAISRAFRLGQKRKVYVYRLIAAGTFEETKYKKAIQKDWLSMSIFTTTATEADAQTDGQIDDGLQGPSERINSRNHRRVEQSLAWEVDAGTCEDGLLEQLLTKDRSEGNSFLKVMEHDSQFHKRASTCCPDAMDWFKPTLNS